MTDHPITPPPELVQRLWDSYSKQSLDDVCTSWKNSVVDAYRAGADQELEACCQVLYARYDIPTCIAPRMAEDMREWLRAARRPKPPSLKEQALADLANLVDDLRHHGLGYSSDTIRRALEQLND